MCCGAIVCAQAGKSALDYAIENEKRECVEVLLDGGAALSPTSKVSHTLPTSIQTHAHIHTHTTHHTPSTTHTHTTIRITFMHYCNHPQTHTHIHTHTLIHSRTLRHLCTLVCSHAHCAICTDTDVHVFVQCVWVWCGVHVVRRMHATVATELYFILLWYVDMLTDHIRQYFWNVAKIKEKRRKFFSKKFNKKIFLTSFST